MAEIVLFHHAQGLTKGVQAFADELRAVGHTVQTPDLLEGKTFDDLKEAVAHLEATGFENVVERGVRAAEGFPAEVVYIGMSLGCLASVKLAQTKPGSKGVVFLHGAAPIDYFAPEWPKGLPLQIHTREKDEYGDIDLAQHIVKTVDTAELFLYPGDDHLFTDSSLPVYDEQAAALVMSRVIAFLDANG